MARRLKPKPPLDSKSTAADAILAQFGGRVIEVDTVTPEFKGRMRRIFRNSLEVFDTALSDPDADIKQKTTIAQAILKYLFDQDRQLAKGINSTGAVLLAKELPADLKRQLEELAPKLAFAISKHKSIAGKSELAERIEAAGRIAFPQTMEE